MKKLITVSLCILLLLGMLAGCTGNDTKTETTTPPTKTSEATEKPSENTATEELEEITLTYWFPSSSEAYNDYMTNAAAEFTEIHPNIKIEVEITPTSNIDTATKLNAAKLGGFYPDVFSAYLLYMGTLAPNGHFLEIDEYFNNWEEKDDVYEAVVDMGRNGGKLYGMGYAPGPRIMVYRKDYFEETGLDPESPPKNWDELLEYSEKLCIKDDDGNIIRAGFDVPAINATVFVKTMMRQNGSKIIDEENNVPAFTDQASIEAFEYMMELKEFSIPFDNVKAEDIPFVKGNSAISFLPMSLAKTLYDGEFKDTMGFVLTMGDPPSAWCGFRLFTIGAESKHPEEAWEFIKFMMSYEQAIIRAQELSVPPVLKSAADEFISYSPEINAATIDAVEYGKGEEKLSWTSIANKYLKTAYEEVYTGSKTAEEALNDALELLEAELKTN